MVYSIQDCAVNVNDVGFDGAALLERFVAQRALELRKHAALVAQVLDDSFFVLVRTAASVRALEPGYCNHKRQHAVIKDVMHGPAYEYDI